MKKKCRTTLVIGGCRSGKSRYALDAANQMAGDNKIYLATSVPADEEMEKRVARHQAERGTDWQTIEEPVLIHEAIANAPAGARVWSFKAVFGVIPEGSESSLTETTPEWMPMRQRQASGWAALRRSM